MDKYEFNIKVEQLKKLVNEKDYQNAMQIADNIDWRRVHNANLLSTVSEIYEEMQDYTEAKEILLLAYERVPVGKHLLYRLTKLAVKEGNIAEAEAYYNEFNEISPNDSRAYLLRYMIMKEKGAPPEQLIAILESYNRKEINEKWMYELAELYHIAGCSDDCVRICDNIMLMFGVGEYVEKAMRLKVEGEGRELNEYQQNLMMNIAGDEEETRGDDPYAAFSARTQEGGEYNEEAEGEDFGSGEDAHVVYEAEEISDSRMMNQDREALLGGDKEDDARRVYQYAPDQAEEEDIFEQIRASRENAEQEDGTVATKPVFRDIEEDPSYSRELEEQEKLRREMSGMKSNGLLKETPEDEKTKIISDLKQAISIEEGAEDSDFSATKRRMQEEDPAGEAQGANQVFEGIDLIDIDDLEEMDLFIIAERNAAKGLEEAVARLKKIQGKRGNKNQVVRVRAGKLNSKGLSAYADKIEGKDLIIEEAGDLSAEAVNELYRIAGREDRNRAIILIDNPLQIEILAKAYPNFAERFGYEMRPEMPADKQPKMREVLREVPMQAKEAPTPIIAEGEEKDLRESEKVREIAALEEQAVQPIEESEQEPRKIKLIRTASQDPVKEAEDEEMDLDRFGEYASDYAKSIDCVIDGKSMLALLERAEIMQAEGIRLTIENAKELIEEAADRAEKPPFIKRIFGFLSRKYNKEGMLILKEEHFI